jgi:hypothetical protein
MIAGVTDWWRFPTYKEFIVMLVICKFNICSPNIISGLVWYVRLTLWPLLKVLLPGYKKTRKSQIFLFFSFQEQHGKTPTSNTRGRSVLDRLKGFGMSFGSCLLSMVFLYVMWDFSMASIKIRPR